MLRDDSRVMVLTNTTKSFITVEIQDCIKRVEGHLNKRAKESENTKLTDIYKDGMNVPKNMASSISELEYLFVHETLQPKGVPTPLILVKDYKKPLENGDYTTRLVVPTTIFRIHQARVHGIKKTSEQSDIITDRHMIQQVSSVKIELEN